MSLTEQEAENKKCPYVNCSSEKERCSPSTCMYWEWISCDCRRATHSIDQIDALIRFFLHREKLMWFKGVRRLEIEMRMRGIQDYHLPEIRKDYESKHNIDCSLILKKGYCRKFLKEAESTTQTNSEGSGGGL